MNSLEKFFENMSKDNTRKVLNNSVEIDKSVFYPRHTNPNTKKIYLLSKNSVIIIDGHTNNMIKKLDIKNTVSIIINPNTNKVYLLSSDPGMITVLDGFSDCKDCVLEGSFDSKLKLEEFLSPRHFQIDYTKNLLYVMNKKLDSVFVINGTDNKIIQTINVNNVESIDLNSTINVLYISCATKKSWFSQSHDNELILFDTETNQITKTINLGTFSWMINSNTNNLYVWYYLGNVLVIDGKNGEIIKTIEDCKLSDCFFSSATNKLYVFSASNDSIYLIDGKTNLLIKRISIKNPGNVIINQKTNRAYVLDTNNQFVYVIDDSTGELIDTILLPFEGSLLRTSVTINLEKNILYAWKFTEIDEGSSNIDFFIFNLSTKKLLNSFYSNDLNCDIEIDANSNQIFIAYFPKKSIFVLNHDATKIIETIDVEKGKIKFYTLPEINKILYTRSTFFKKYLGMIN